MKALKIVLNIALIAFALFAVQSCNKTEKPQVSILELGYENSAVAYIGSDLHIEAEIVAEAKVRDIRVVIEHDEAEKHEGEFSFDSTYTDKYAGVINADFHEHIDIPLETETGTYLFTMTVNDEEGQVSEKSRQLSIESPQDDEMPVITVNSAPEDGQVFTTGETISISGTVTDNYGIAGLYVGLVKESQNLTDAEVTHENTISLLHTHDFDDPANVSFDASIEIGASQDNDQPETKPINWESGNYYLLVKAPNALGGGAGLSAHYLVEVRIEK